MKILVGADPEMFVKKDGLLVSAHGLVKGDKANPHPVNGGAVQVDGMALEFNINPASDESEWVNNLGLVMNALKEMVPHHEVLPLPTAHFGREYIEAQPEEAKELGCEPDYNAYTEEVNPMPDGGKGYRTGAGHIHIGWTENMPLNDPGHWEACVALVKQLDLYLGIPSLCWDKDTERRELYGKAGAFRVKSYGVEYRTLSNSWLVNESRMRFVYKQVRSAFNSLMSSEGVPTTRLPFVGLVNDVINRPDLHARARPLIREKFKGLRHVV